MPQAQPELRKVRFQSPGMLDPDYYLCLLQYMEKRLFVQLNGNRKVLGILRGYDVRDRGLFLSSPVST
jgi:small nuclear ribonucleoprotein G